MGFDSTILQHISSIFQSMFTYLRLFDLKDSLLSGTKLLLQVSPTPSGILQI